MQSRHHVEISTQPLDVSAALNFVAEPTFGACASFIGTIRNFNQGKPVTGISYDVHVTLAEKVITQLCEEAQQRWGPELKIYLTHYKGRLNVGAASVVIAVGSPHRDAAFKACRYLIEEIKHRCPIWKQEHYQDGDSEWVQGHALCAQ